MYLFDNIASPNFKAAFDPANFIQCGVLPYPHAYNLLKDNIVYLHIKDATSDGTVVPSGLGIGRLKELFAELHKNNFEGFLAIEPHLVAFPGFENLKDETVLNQTMSAPEAFTLAYNSLARILEEIVQ